MIEYIGCRNCVSPNCKGCNMLTLARMLNSGKFDCLMNENRSIDRNAEVEPVKHGKWVRDLTYGGKHKEIYYCSLCNHWQSNRRNREPGMSAFHMRYCPNCGAKMKGGAENA